MVDIKQNASDIELLKERMKDAEESLAEAEASISDLYGFANGEVVQRDLLAGVDLSKTTSVTDIGASNEVTFTHPYTEYDYLEFVGYDGDRWLCDDWVSVAKVKRLFEIAKTTKEKEWFTYIYLKNTSDYLIVWEAQNCTETKWDHLKANGRTLASIYGVRVKKGTANG